MAEVDRARGLPKRDGRKLGLQLRSSDISEPPFDATPSLLLEHLAAGAVRHLAGIATILLIANFYHHVTFANETTVGFTFLLAVLCASTVWGLSVAIFMSISAALAYDYYFLPPVGIFNISDARDWVALCAFLITAGIGAYLSAWARREARTANQRQRETEQLYRFSQGLLATGDPTQLLDVIPRCVIESFATGLVALCLKDRSQVHLCVQRGEGGRRVGVEALVNHEEALAKDGQTVHIVPLRIGEQDLGTLRIAPPVPSPATLEAVGTMAVAAIERAQAIERSGKMEAARESEQLKSVLLDAIAHDFKTPLTSIKGSATALLSELEFNREERKTLLELIDEECDRVTKLINAASEMAKLDAGQIRLELTPRPVGELISAALADCQMVLREREIELEVSDPGCLVRVDLPVATKVLIHLIDNANLYSSPGQPIAVRAARQHDLMSVSVSDRGPGIEEPDLDRIFEKFYRGRGQRDRVDGTGMGLAIAAAIVRAHGGSIEAISSPGEGSTFTFYLPVAIPTFS